MYMRVCTYIDHITDLIRQVSKFRDDVLLCYCTEPNEQQEMQWSIQYSN